jgi:hypothetical protein
MTGSGIIVTGLSSAYIYHNSFYGVNPTIAGTQGSAAMVYIGGTITNTGIVVKNNAYYGTANASKDNYPNLYRDGGSVCDINYNLYFQENSSASITNILGIGIGKNKMSEFGAYKTATGYDSNSPTPANPLFVSSSDLHLRSGSPAINSGVDVGIATDFDGNPRVGAPDIGAFEYTG